MRNIDPATLRALQGSRPADKMVAWVWRGGRMLLPGPLEIINWTARDNAGESSKVAQQLSFQIADPDGKLGAWRLDDPLGVSGSRLHVSYLVGGAGMVNFGRFRITDNQPDEVVETRVVDEFGYIEPDGSLEPHKRRKYIIRSTVRLEAVDLTLEADNNKFDAPQSPPGYPAPTVKGEVVRLLGEHFPVAFDLNVPDTPVSTMTIYESERLEAAQDLLALVGARYRMDGDGIFRAYIPGGAPVARIEPTAGLVQVMRKQSITGLYNRWVVEGKEAEDGSKLVAAVTLDSGPLAYGGTHGKVTYRASSSMIETWEQAYAYAQRLRAEFLASLAVELQVSTVPLPHLQGGDRVEIGCPLVEGYVVYMPGTITAIERQGSTVPGETKLTVTCSYADVDRALSTTPWAQYLTTEKPELTWNRMPATWGNTPDVTWDSLT